jgi:hypothetical protein
MIEVKNLVVVADNQTRSCFGRFIFSGDYPLGGEPINPTDVGAPGGGEPPLWTQLVGRRQDKMAYAYFIDYQTWTLTVKSLSAGGSPGTPPAYTDVPAGAYPPDVVTDSVDFYIRFPKF